MYFDTVTHDPDQLQLLGVKPARGRIVCGSDYPFDMAQPDPVEFAVRYGTSAASLAANGREFLGLAAAATDRLSRADTSHSGMKGLTDDLTVPPRSRCAS